MGYQLWTSKVTGHRRTGTRLSDLRTLFGTTIMARTMLEPLRSCPADAPAEEMEHVLKQRGFDVAGVQAVEHGPVIGFVMRETLRGGTVKDHVRPISAEHLISDGTPLNDLLAVLHSKERVFVLIGPNVRGIVTRADLSKPPMRVYLFGLISLLEMHLRFWVRMVYPEDSWQKTLNGDRLGVANALQEKRRARNEEITLLDCLQLCDKRDLLLASDNFRTRFGLASKRQTESFLMKAEALRDRLAHSQDDLVQRSSWPDLIKLVEWIEALIHTSDEAVEQEAKVARKNVDTLWAAG